MKKSSSHTWRIIGVSVKNPIPRPTSCCVKRVCWVKLEDIGIMVWWCYCYSCWLKDREMTTETNVVITTSSQLMCLRFVSYDWNYTLWVAFLVLQIINCSCPFHIYYYLVCYLMFSIFFVCSDLPATSVRELLLPAIQNLLKDLDALDPAHKEALEIILKERSGGTLEAISKVMGAHLGIASSVTSLFGEGGLLGKKDSGDPPPEPVESPRAVPPPPAEDTRFMRIMRGNFTDMLRSKAKNQEDTSTGQWKLPLLIQWKLVCLWSLTMSDFPPFFCSPCMKLDVLMHKKKFFLVRKIKRKKI